MVYLERTQQGTEWSITETNRLVGSLTRRRLITAATAAALLRDLPAGAQSPEASPTGTRVVETDKGPVTVPARAERVVCADFYGAFAVVDLGLTPIGAGGSGFDFTGEPYSTLLADVPSTGDFQEPDLEAILALDPDLILRTIDTEDDLYARLSAIASTVVLSFQGMSLQDVAVRVGEALGRENEANALLQEYHDACAQIASTHADVLAENTFAYVASASDATFWFMGPSWTDTTVLLDCGVRLSEPSASQTEQVAEYSLEQLVLLSDTDVILINADADGVTPSFDTEVLTGSPIWASLPAVKAGKVFAIPYGAASLGAGIVLAERLDQILSELSAG